MTQPTLPTDLKPLLDEITPKPSLNLIDVTELQKLKLPALFVPKNHDVLVLTDLERHLPTPLRKTGTVTLDDAASFIWYVKEHQDEERTRIYLKADYPKGYVAFTAVLNDHPAHGAQWRDHTAEFAPAKSTEWLRWTSADRKGMTQLEFATWIEDNMTDIATVQGMPTAAQMLELALTFEAVSDKKFKSATRIQSGGIDLEYIDREDDATRSKMKMFERFSIGIPVFAAPIAEAHKTDPATGEIEKKATIAYRIDARLKYRIRDGVLQLWFELVRADKVLASASQDLVNEIRTQTSLPLLAGSPNL
ncbi:DUF2303 family protein [Chitinibacteraceae bacterium HSL-7]